MSASERRARSIVCADRKMTRSRTSRPADAALRGRFRDLTNKRWRFGYRRMLVLLQREAELSAIDRLYGEEGLTVRKRRAKAVGTCAPILVEARPTRAGRWTSATTSSPTAGACASSSISSTDVTKMYLSAIPESSISGRRGLRTGGTRRRRAGQE